jgi:hypothetical protein
LGWFGGYLAAAEHVIGKLELQMKRRKAQLSQYWQKKKADGMKLTVQDIEHNMLLDETVQEYEQQLLDARYNQQVLKFVHDSFVAKHRALQSDVGLQRSEIEADLYNKRLQASESFQQAQGGQSA